MTVVRSNSARQPHTLLIDLAVFNDQDLISSTDDPQSSQTSFGSGSSGDSSSSSARYSSSVLFSVLCLHEYNSAEENGLSFRKGEILEILKQESTGWWAARRKQTREIGWIPKAYVEQLSPEQAGRYAKMREEIRCYERDAEQLYAEAPVTKLNLIDSDPEFTLSSLSRNNSGTKPSRPLSPPTLIRAKSRDGIYERRPHNVVTSNPTRPVTPQRSHKSPHPPPSPTSPMPHPPPQSAPCYNKPVPPLPDEAVTRDRSGSLQSSRSLRRRPLLLDDNTALSRLSTLIETKNSREIDRYADPDITGSIHALTKRSQSEQGRRKENSVRGRTMPTEFQPLKKPWYILPAHADQLEFDNEGNVRAGSLVALVERLTSESAFIEPGSNGFTGGRKSFASVFLMTFRTFTTSDQLFDMLLDRFSMTRPDNLNEIEVDDWKKRCLLPTQRRVLAVFTYWLEEHRLLEEDRHIAKRLPDFVTHVAMPRLRPESQALMQTFERLTFADPIRPPNGLTPRKPRKSKAHRNDLLRMDPSDIAEQLTLYEYNRYSTITPRECLAYVRTQKGDSVMHLNAFCATYDQLAGWVKLSILNNDAIAKRAATIDFWIKVAEVCNPQRPSPPVLHT
ncbi:cell division control protein 25 [Coprinopsis cinerea AmutBmut pab1-1]|nr:cell division control protein 25 [Coprinopsis cinerea AmutBmut pab1-1]